MMRCCRVIIPFRDRGTDSLRAANLERVLQQWGGLGFIACVVDDGRDKGPFNRCAAYNRGAAATEADVIIYAEADALICERQIRKAITMASARPGLVIPFRQYRSLLATQSKLVRLHRKEPADCVTAVHHSIGAVNVVSRVTLKAIGQWDECFTEHWFEENAMEQAFRIAAGPTRWVDGPAYHLYHQPQSRNGQITLEDRVACANSSRRLQLYRNAKTPERIRELTAGGW